MIQRFWKLLLLLLAQVLVLNHIHVLGYATPILLPYLTMHFPRGASRVSLLLWGFGIGLGYDMFSNTMGMGMASATLLGLLQPVLLNLTVPRDSAEDLVPSPHTMTTGRYHLYVFFSLFIFHLVFYALDAFTLANWWLTVLALVGGTLLSFLLVLMIQLFNKNAHSSSPHGQQQQHAIQS